jgi:hypothetical protein
VYRDEDNDEITVDCQEDYTVLICDITANSNGKGKSLKLEVKE